MQFAATFKLLGILLMIFSMSMLPPLGVALWYGDGGLVAFLASFIATFAVGLILYLTFMRYRKEVSLRDGCLVVTLLWIVLSLFGTIPFLVNMFPRLSFTDAVFETVSGLTTTGATVLAHLSTLPHAVLYYRQQLHLLGGIGIIVLAVAVLPMLGVGGMQLYRAEIAGPVKTSKLTPRIASTAKALWIIYFGIAACCALAYWASGMTLFDAIGESFSTVSTGGFATHDSSFAYYHSAVIDFVAIVFMILGATNFSLHFHFLKTKRVSTYLKDPEFKAYLMIIVVVTLVTVITLLFYRYYHVGRNFLNALFTAVSVGSTTGLSTTNFSIWPTFLPYLIMFVALIGGCAGSTSGGIKVVRCLLLKAQSSRELRRLLHPKAVLSIKLGDERLPEETIQAIWGFVAIFFALFIVLLLVLLATGLDFTTAFGALTACLSNTGAGIGKVFGNFDSLNVVAKWFLVFAMLAGRLEIFTIMVLFTRSYWRR